MDIKSEIKKFLGETENIKFLVELEPYIVKIKQRKSLDEKVIKMDWSVK